MSSYALCLSLLAAAAAQTADPRESARQVLARGRFQADLPDASPRPSAADIAGRIRPEAGRSTPREPRRTGKPTLPLPPAGLVWAVLAGAIVIALGWAVHRAMAARRGGDAEPAPVPPPREAGPARRGLRIGPLTDVEDLARLGRFGEAIHLLLLHLFEALQRRPATAPAPAHTGREVLARTRLAADARAALGVLVLAAERIHFGGRAAVREDYENCLGHYRRFLDSFERAS